MNDRKFVPNGIVLHGEVKIHEAVASYPGVTAVVEADGPQHEGAFAHDGQQVMQDAFPFRRVFFEQIAVFLTEPVGFSFLATSSGTSEAKSSPLKIRSSSVMTVPSFANE